MLLGVIKNENGNNATNINKLNNNNNNFGSTLRAGNPQNSATKQARSAVQARFEYAYGKLFLIKLIENG